MSEYYDDSDIRRYTPVLQRVIILLAVIIAVPVVMWTITTVVRTYVAAPKAPTFQHLTDTQPPGDTVSDSSLAASASTTPPVHSPAPTAQLADAQAAATQARTALLEIKKPADTPSPSVAPQAPPLPAAVATAAPSAAVALPPAPAAGASVSIPPASMESASVTPATTASASSASVAGAKSAAAMPATAPSSPGNVAWPNPKTTAPPDIGQSASPAPSAGASTGTVAANAAEPAATATASAALAQDLSQDLPPGAPIAGPVPLPRHRPMLFAVALSAIPLPRPRPLDAPAAPPPTTDAVAPSYEPGLDPGHY